MILSKTYRYDIKDRNYTGTPLKYYFTDVGLRNARLNFRQRVKDHIMENILCNELPLREYGVNVGSVEDNIVPWHYEKGILPLGIEDFLLDGAAMDR